MYSKTIIALLNVCFFLAFITAANADDINCASSFTKTTNFFDGTVNKKPVRMVLTLNDKTNLKGLYAYSISPTAILLSGQILDGNKISLSELDDQHNPTATFVGIFEDKGCTKITGSWHNLKSNQETTFELEHNGESTDTIENMYSSWQGDFNTVEKAAVRLRTAILAGDKQTVAKCFAYPVKISFTKKPGKTLLINNSTQLIKNYGKIFTPQIIKATRNTIPHFLDAMSEGIIFTDNGEIWLNGDGKVKEMNV